VGLELQPLNLNEWLLRQEGGYDREGNINPYAIVALSRLAGKPLIYRYRRWDPAVLEAEISNARPAIVELDLTNIGLPGSHFLVVKGISPSTEFLVNDPDLNNARMLSEYGGTHHSIRTFAPTQTDLSTIFVSIVPPLEFVVSPLAEEESGFNAAQGDFDGIAGAEYYLLTPLADDGATGAANLGAQQFDYPSPEGGDFSVYVWPSDVTTYSIAFYAHNVDGNPTFLMDSRAVSPNFGQQYRLEYSPAPGEILRVQLVVDIDVKPGSDPNTINCGNANAIVPVGVLTTEAFDATTLDHVSLTFEGASEIHMDSGAGVPRRHEEDIDGDGDIDLVFHARLGHTQLNCDSEDGTLTGITLGGQSIVGTDAIRMVRGK
jgi:hypothetical protein